jgi:iron complex outermembrane receptor protein
MHKFQQRSRWLAGVSLLATAASLMAGAAYAADDESKVDAVIVTGTRTTGLKAVDSPAPVQVLGADMLQKSGQPDLIQGLAQNVPSMHAQAGGGDLSAFHLSIKQRGMSPNHTLVLVNGKRRHGTANVVVSGGAFGGNAAPDIGLIPAGAIDHVEVLQEGAAAQYGTDAIAGVVNFILKKKPSGGSIVLDAGQYFDGGGRTGHAQVNLGVAPIENSYLNMTLETKWVGNSFRGDVDPRVVAGRPLITTFPGITSFPYYPYVNRVGSGAEYRMTSFIYNAGYDVSDALQLYSFGSYAYRWGQSPQNYRLPSVVVGRGVGDTPFPGGFQPAEGLTQNDYSFTGGAQGDVAGWHFDVASTYAKDKNEVFVYNSANQTLYRDNSTTTTKGFSPSTFHDGDFEAKQWVNTIDVTHDYEVGLATPLTVAAGAEYRKEWYAVIAGDPASYYGTGAQSFFGYSPVNAGSHSRHNWGVYLDLAASPIEQWKVDAAIRHEKYSDFGSTTVWKLTNRYDFNDKIAIRGTISTGFRAPTLAEEFYSGINVGPTSVSGVFAPNSSGAAFLGIAGLKPEKSKNYSVGFVTHPLPGVTATLDLYRIDMKDRIVQSGSFFGYNSNTTVIRSPSVLAALAANGVAIDPAIFTAPSGTVSIVSFVNGLNTKTQGADFVATYTSDFDAYGRVNWSLSANYNKVKIKKVAAPPSNIDQRVALLDLPARAVLTTSTPKARAALGADWKLGMFGVTVRETYVGKAFSYAQHPTRAEFTKIQIDPTFLTDLELSVEPVKDVRIAVGATNLFNKYPDKNPAEYRAAQFSTQSTGYVSPYPAFSAFGINGGYYYARLSVNF